jgi:hypothetical protein
MFLSFADQAAQGVTPLDAVTKIAIPILSPLIAVVAVLVGLRQEFRRVRVQQGQDQKQRANAVSGEVFSAIAVSGLMVREFGDKGAVSPEALTEVRAGLERIVTKLRAEPEFGDYLRDRVKFARPSENPNRMFLMLFEAGRRLANKTISKDDLRFAHFTLLTLTYLYETKSQREHSDAYSALKAMGDNLRNEYELFLVDASTPSFR